MRQQQCGGANHITVDGHPPPPAASPAAAPGAAARQHRGRSERKSRFGLCTVRCRGYAGGHRNADDGRQSAARQVGHRNKNNNEHNGKDDDNDVGVNGGEGDSVERRTGQEWRRWQRQPCVADETERRQREQCSVVTEKGAAQVWIVCGSAQLLVCLCVCVGVVCVCV